MDSHRAKRKALRKYCNELRLAINADLDNLSFKLCAESLIPQEVRDRKAADDIVSSVESRLGFDESAWEKLIKVLYSCDAGNLAGKLVKQLTVELSGEDAPGGNIPGGQQQNGGECCMLYNDYLSDVIVVLHALGKRRLFKEAIYVDWLR